MKTLMRYALTLGVAVITISANAQTQTKKEKEAAKAAAVKEQVMTKRYTFIAQYAQPLRGGQKYLTTEYDLKIRPDSVIAELPYYGRVYMDVPLNPDEAGVNFTSTKFDYVISDRKKGGWSVVIELHDVKRNNKLRLDIFTNGTATLQALSNTRDMINFTGYIEEKK
jgi:hypothetical protein